MRLRLSGSSQSTHPNELIVSLKTVSGSEKLVVHKRSIEDNSLNVGYPIDASEAGYLVELPMETLTGSWRVWVPKEEVFEATSA
jgi:hypothetical protein